MRTVRGKIGFVLLACTYPAFILLRLIGRISRPLLRAIGLRARNAAGPEAYWCNSIANQFACPQCITRPASLDELRAIVREAREKGVRVRPLGAGLSFSDVAVGDEYIVDTRGLDRVLPIDTAILRDGVVQETLVRIEGGIGIRKVNDELAQRGLALQNMGGWDGQSVAGAVSTATHGSGLRIGAANDFVEWVELLCEDGKLRIIQAADGPIDPSRYSRSALSGEAELVSNDELFFSAVVSLGAAGIIYAFGMRVRRAFRLRETRVLRDWAEVKAELLGGRLAEVKHYEVLVNPYRDGEKRLCLVTERSETSEAPRGRDARERNPHGVLFTQIPAVDGFLSWLFRKFPTTAPWLIDRALKSLQDREYIDDSYRVYNLGEANRIPAFSSEQAFAVDSADGSVPAYLAAIEEIFVMAEQEARRGRWHTVPVSLRFVKASKHLMAMHYGRDTCQIEIPFLVASAEGWNLLRYYERRLYAFGARPHWGQAHFHLGVDRVSRLYDRFDTWVNACLSLNRHGTFDSLLTERFGFAVRRKPDNRPPLTLQPP